jgi:putative ABC transport system ATP-binding protein
MLFELDSVSLSRGGRPVLDGFSARIPAGATAIVGPSGSGKSSLLRLLNRLSDPDSGQVLYRGEPVAERDVLELRREVGLVPQLPALVAGSVADNIHLASRYGCRDHAPDVPRLLGLAGLDPSYADRDAGRLSVGEQQRAMLARALAVEPRVLLLDEPTSALDRGATEAVERALVELRRRVDLSLVLVTHDPSQAARLAETTIGIDPAGVRTAEEVGAG